MTKNVKDGYLNLTPGNWPTPGTIEPAWAPLIREQAELIRKLTIRIEELEAARRFIETVIDRHDVDITTLFIDMSMIRSGGQP